MCLSTVTLLENLSGQTFPVPHSKPNPGLVEGSDIHKLSRPAEDEKGSGAQIDRANIAQRALPSTLSS